MNSSFNVEHIVWEDRIYKDVGEKVYGLCEIELIWHGSGSDHHIVQGTYEFTANGRFTNHALGIKLDENTVGLAGVNLIRVGTIVE